MDVDQKDHYRYWAFISYSHLDEDFAIWLHRKIEAYRVVKALVGKPHSLGEIPNRIKPVFRDRDELPSSADLGSKIREALKASRYLVIICSPESAKSRYVNEEIQYFKSLHRHSRVLAIILRGEPDARKKGKPNEECFPEALTVASEFDEQVASPLAADARPQGDGPNRAFLKIVAGLLEVGFDDLARREVKRRRLFQMRMLIAAMLCTVGIALGYVLLADAKFDVPGHAQIRAWLDRYQVTLFRPLYSDDEIQAKASSLRRQLISAVMANATSEALVYSPPNVDPGNIDPWSSAQVLAGLGATADLEAMRARCLLDGLKYLLEKSAVRDGEGQPIGWRFLPQHPPIGIATAWMADATAMAHKHISVYDQSQRGSLESMTSQIVGIAEIYASPDSQGWFLYPDEAVPERRNCYVAILMLQALVSFEETGLVWNTNERHRELARKTADFLIKQYDNGGWRRANDDHDPGVAEGMSVQGFCALLRAERSGIVQLPDEILTRITEHLLECSDRYATYENSNAEFEHLVLEQGQPRPYRELVTFLWYPWSVQCACLWLERAKRLGARSEDVVGVRRALGHMVITLGDEIVADGVKSPPHVAGELLYALAAIPSGNLAQETSPGHRSHK